MEKQSINLAILVLLVVVDAVPVKVQKSLDKKSTGLVIDEPKNNILYTCWGKWVRFTVTTAECRADLCLCIYDGSTGAKLPSVCAKSGLTTGHGTALTSYCEDASWSEFFNVMKGQIPANFSSFSRLRRIRLYLSRQPDGSCDLDLQEAVSNGQQLQTLNIRPCDPTTTLTTITTTAYFVPANGTEFNMGGPVTMGVSNKTMSYGRDPTTTTAESLPETVSERPSTYVVTTIITMNTTLVTSRNQAAGEISERESPSHSQSVGLLIGFGVFVGLFFAVIMVRALYLCKKNNNRRTTEYAGQTANHQLEPEN